MSNQLIKIEQQPIGKFWEHVNILGPNGCWIWQGDTNKKGYGRINVMGKVWLAHRLSYLIHYGINPSALCVLHSCDNPSCINPEHLSLGTKADNNMDMIAKGRAAFQRGTAVNVSGLLHGRYTKPQSTARGERNGSTKLSDFAIDVMRVCYNNGSLSQRLLSKAFNIHISTVNRIVNNKSRKACQTN